MLCVDVAVIGGGPAGLAAALAAKDAGAERVLLIERDSRLGGILNQCIHNGFGLHRFKEELCGPEYAQRYIDMSMGRGIDFMLGTIALSVSPDKIISCSSKDGFSLVKAEAVVFAMGCRERSRGALNVPGFRPAGVYSAGTAQRLMNIDGFMPGRKVVIVGSGDIGLIMARRMSLEGASVSAVVEMMPYSGGLKRNIVQCLDDFGIPLLFSCSVSRIYGKKRVEGVSVVKLDAERREIAGSEQYFECDTLLYSVGLIPENELGNALGLEKDPETSGPFVNEKLMTRCPGIFACGNVLHVHDLADNVSKEAERAGRFAAEHAAAMKDPARRLSVENGAWESVRLESPVKEKNYAVTEGSKELTCIKCPKGCTLHLEYPDTVTGFSCPLGEEYARSEMRCPMRTVCSAVRIIGGSIAMLPVRTRSEVPKAKTAAIMKAVHGCSVKAPISCGDTVISDIAGTGVDLIATADIGAPPSNCGQEV